MENNDKSKYRKSAILSGILTIAILTSACSNFSEDVTIVMNEKKEDEDVKPKVEVEEEATWVQYDESALMYRVDFDRFLKDKLKLSEKVLENSDVVKLLELIHEELGEDLYAKDKNDNMLYNLDGKSVNISTYFGYYTYLSARFYGSEDSLEENTLVYQIDIRKSGKTERWSRSREEGLFKFSKYYISNIDNKEYTRAIFLRESDEKYLGIGLHEGGVFSGPCNISFSTHMGEASVKLSKEDYDALREIMLAYSDSDNLYEFLSDNLDLLNKYLDLIREKDAEFYEHLCSLINEYIEKAKTLRYE